MIIANIGLKPQTFITFAPLPFGNYLMILVHCKRLPKV